jgi:hypothetical protein
MRAWSVWVLAVAILSLLAGTSFAQVASEITGEPADELPMELETFPYPDIQRSFTPGYDFNQTGDFENALAFPGTNALFKIGGYVKLDAIQDFDPIGSEDVFDPSSIEIGAPPRTNSRFHARQTRLNLDTRWPADCGPARVFVEGDFFGDGDTFRLRHAFGEVGPLLAGYTWTTFTDLASFPQTIDFQRGVATITTRRAQVRYTGETALEGSTWSIAAEDSTVVVDAASMIPGSTRTPMPDFVGRVRWTADWGQFQVAGIARQLGFQPVGQEVRTAWAGGVNFTGFVRLWERDKWLFQVVAGEGIGSFRDLPDAAPDSPTTLAPLPTFAWMTGYAHAWNERWTTNVTYNLSRVSNTALQAPDAIHQTEYLAVNLIWNPADRIWTGIEYLHGTRTDFDGSSGEANRLQFAVLFELP